MLAGLAGHLRHGAVMVEFFAQTGSILEAEVSCHGSLGEGEIQFVMLLLLLLLAVSLIA